MNDHLLPNAPYPMAAMPPMLRDFTERVSLHTQVSPALVAPLVISATAAAVQGLVDVETPYGAVVPTSLFYLISPHSGDRVSAAARLVKRTFLEFEAGGLAATGTVGDPEKPKPLPFHQFFVDVTTDQGITDIQLAGCNSIFAAPDEGSQFFRFLNTAAWCKRWDADPMRINTRKTGAIVLRDKRVSMCVSVQTPILKGILKRKGEQLIGSGFFPRALFSMPPTLQGSRASAIDAGLDRFSTADHPYHQLLRTLMVEYGQALAQGNAFKRKVLKLSPGATNCWRDIDREIEVRLAPGGEFYDIAGFAAKAGENLVRQAGVFEYAETRQEVIQPWTMHQAAEQIWWHLTEAKRAFGLVPPEIMMAHHAALLMQWLRTRPNGTVTQSMIEGYGPAPIRIKADLELVLHHLEQRSCISTQRSGRSCLIWVNIPRWAY
jgi:hypothetical protein